MQLLEVAEFLHGQGLVHRSFTPGTLAWCAFYHPLYAVQSYEWCIETVPA